MRLPARIQERRFQCCFVGVVALALGGCVLPRVSESASQPARPQTIHGDPQVDMTRGSTMDAGTPGALEEAAVARNDGSAGADGPGSASQGGDAATSPNGAMTPAAGSGSAQMREADATSGSSALSPATVAPPHTFAEWRMPSGLPGSQTAPSYAVTVDTVTDNVTGLVWQREQPETYPGCTGKHNNDSEPGALCTWDEAKRYCGSQPLAALLGGTGWRLPTKIELESLLDENRDDQMLYDRTLFPKGLDKLWTFTAYAGRVGEAWFVAFYEFGSSFMETANGLEVICVR